MQVLHQIALQMQLFQAVQALEGFRLKLVYLVVAQMHPVGLRAASKHQVRKIFRIKGFVFFLLKRTIRFRRRPLFFVKKLPLKLNDLKRELYGKLIVLVMFFS